MFKKILLIILIIAIVITVVIISPLSSLLAKSLLEYKLKNTYNVTAAFEGFNLRLFQNLEIKKANFSKDRVKLKTGNIILKPVYISLIERKFILDCSIKNVTFYSKAKDFFVILGFLSGNSGLSNFNQLNFNYAKAQIIINKKIISLKDIEAVGSNSKLYGNIIRHGDKTNYSLDLYLPSKVTEDMSGIMKSLLGVDVEGDWAKFKIRFSTLKK